MSDYTCEAGDSTVVADRLPDGWVFDDESGGHICPDCAREMQAAWDALTPEEQAREREQAS